jgi:UDP-3-O-[3-hydroxymyristoyl] glucosamine N-acyltransferase
MQTIEPSDKYAMWKKLERQRLDHPDEWLQLSPTSGWVHKTSIEYFLDMKPPESARIGMNVIVQDYVLIGEYVAVDKGAILGRDIALGPGSSVGENSCLGKETILLAGAVIEPGVVLGERVTIGTAATVKSDSVLQRGVTVGDRTVIDKDVTIARDTTIGDDCRINAQSTIGIDPQTGAIGLQDLAQPDHEAVRIGKGVNLGPENTVSMRVTIQDNTWTAEGVEIINETPHVSPMTVGEGTRIEKLAKLATSCWPGCQIGTAATVGAVVEGTKPIAVGIFNEGRDYSIAPDGTISVQPLPRIPTHGSRATKEAGVGTAREADQVRNARRPARTYPRDVM